LNSWSRTMLTAFYAANPLVEAAALPAIPSTPEGVIEARWRVIWPLYLEHAEKARTEHGRAPLTREDLAWCSGAGVAREEMRTARRVWREKFCRAVTKHC
jgi:hypothetical protein